MRTRGKTRQPVQARTQTERTPSQNRARDAAIARLLATLGVRDDRPDRTQR